VEELERDRAEVEELAEEGLETIETSDVTSG
jgi:hypothetical protein